MILDKNKLLEKALQIRYFEERLLEEYKKGYIHGTIHTCIGQEIFPCILAEFTKNYYWFSNHRGHGHYIAKTGDFRGLAAEILLKEYAAAGGIGGSQHLKNKNFISNGIQGGQAGIATGYSSSLFNEGNYASVMFLGDGTLGAGHIYEAFNLAGIYDSNIIFILEDNKIAQSTPSSKTFFGDIKKIVQGYNIDYEVCDSSNFESMLNTIEKIVNKSKRPRFIHLNTQRLSSHSKSDDNRKDEEINNYIKKDLLNKYILDGRLSYNSKYIEQVKKIFDEVLNSKNLNYVNTVKQTFDFKISNNKLDIKSKFSEHISSSLQGFMNNNINSLVIGEDIEDDPFESGKIYGGAFKATKGLSTAFPQRVFSMPISESGFTGFGTGLALRNQYVIIEIMFADFLSQNFDQIFHQLTKIPSIYGKYINLPVLIRTAGFAGNGYGPTHSSSMESVFFGLPNLDIFIPNLFFDYSNILNYFQTAKSPTLVIEPKNLYNKSIFPEVYGEYELLNNNFTTILKPKNRKAICTVFVYGPEFDLIVSNLAFLAKEHEIYINVFSPIHINNLNEKLLMEYVNDSNKNLLNLNQSIFNYNIGNQWIIELLKKNEFKLFSSKNIIDWIPTGRSEKAVILSKDEIIQILMDINDRK